ncbi:hypothetical protein [Achromobacter ruhlandii]|uniref:Uncharacterized protein n=1 Tax=Achromobacter ruhlandii TaxID=72557 RepID=A0A2M9GPE9_9BURK|nr:hypothetical protein [Achromobacter ruhlandii]PJM66445.1 hypothetical protein CV751_30265 [Achromobacter ruhlandii]CAB3919876.1 hypothetical protein LMG3328_05299 [Achromobacter ruhlandii]
MASKPTHSQLKRLHQIANGDIYRQGHTWISSFYVRGINRSIPYDMMYRMHKAGWIDARTTDGFYYNVVLTDVGREILALPKDETKNQYPIGYMQGRGAA